MIKVENEKCDIETSDGPEGIMADLSFIVRAIKKTLIEKWDYSEAEVKDTINRAVELGLLTNKELEQETLKAMGEFLEMLMSNSPL